MTAFAPDVELPPFPRLDAARVPVAPAPSRPLPEWSLVLADGVTMPVYGEVVVGRNPDGTGHPGASLAAVADETRTMSKTHARFFIADEALRIDDLGSTNGVALFPGGNPQGAMAVEPGEPVELRSGDVVQLGEYDIIVRRN
ncbi:MAG: FHA domain-containing protein [Pseudoclavibacter sp.]|nr:FHA domain-containing protein [Pseudoclavibacter sp.]